MSAALAELAAALWDARQDEWEPARGVATLPDGREVSLRIVQDDVSAFDSSDLYGTFEWADRGGRGRPCEMDGAARLVGDGRDAVWWQPPADLCGRLGASGFKSIEDQRAALASVEKRVRRYFRGDWCMVGLVLRVGDDSHAASIWGVESDVDDAYGRELVAHLLSEVPALEVCVTPTELMQRVGAYLRCEEDAP